MSFYDDDTTREEKQRYANMLATMGSFSRLFSQNDKPYLETRIAENVFCKYLHAENLSRSDVTADAKKGNIGIGIKTWIGSNLQKIAEFNAQKPSYEKLDDNEMVFRIATLRNERIAFTMRNYALDKMVYHCTVREKGKILIKECPLVPINLKAIKRIARNGNIITFSDDQNAYSFNTSKSTLYKDFSSMTTMEELNVNIINDPFQLLEKLEIHYAETDASVRNKNKEENVVYLPLYSIKNGERIVHEKSGLNIRFAAGRHRDPYEVYIPIPRSFNAKYRNFFPGRDENFTIKLPNGKILSAKICQSGDKALMSNPNKALGHWFFDEVFKIPPTERITYAMLEKYGIDSIRIQKEKPGVYVISFATIGSYEAFMGSSENDATGIVERLGSVASSES